MVPGKQQALKHTWVWVPHHWIPRATKKWSGVRHYWHHWLPHQSHLTLCNPMNCRQPGSSVHGIFQARIHPSQVMLGAHHHPILQWRPQPPLTSSLGFPLHLILKYLPCSWCAFHRSSGLSLLFLSSWYPCLGLLPFTASTTLPSPVDPRSSRPWDPTHISCVSCIGRWVCYPSTTWYAGTVSVSQNLSTGFGKQLSKAWHPGPNGGTWKEKRF